MDDRTGFVGRSVGEVNSKVKSQKSKVEKVSGFFFGLKFLVCRRVLDAKITKKARREVRSAKDVVTGMNTKH